MQFLDTNRFQRKKVLIWIEPNIIIISSSSFNFYYVHIIVLSPQVFFPDWIVGIDFFTLWFSLSFIYQLLMWYRRISLRTLFPCKQLLIFSNCEGKNNKRRVRFTKLPAIYFNTQVLWGQDWLRKRSKKMLNKHQKFQLRKLHQEHN